MYEAVAEDAEKHDAVLVYVEWCEVVLDCVGAEYVFVVACAVVDAVPVYEVNDE